MKHTKKILSCFMAMAMLTGSLPKSEYLSVANIAVVNAASVYTTSKTGTEDGYDFELWNQNEQGNTTMTLLGNGAFSCEWSGIENCLFRTGKKLGSTKKFQDYNGIYIDYDVDYEVGNNQNSYMCVYGWTENPTVEYYIVESWGSWRPPGGQGKIGTTTVDGATYDIYKTTRVNQPSIHGTETFEQYWSVRQTKPPANGSNIKGTISVSKHFEAWEKAGLKMGDMYEVALNIEGYQSSGKATVKTNNLVFGKEPDGSGNTNPGVTDPIPAQPAISGTAPTGSGTGITDTFEGTGTTWAPRGDSVNLLLTSDMTHGGSKSLAVTGRTASWNGISASSSDLKAGSSYSFSSYVGYKNDAYSSSGFEFGLQYDLDGQTNYDNIGSATASSGEWTLLSGDFDVPSGAENISIYVQSAYSENDTAKDMIDFFIDDVTFSGDSGNIAPSTPVFPSTPEFTFGDINDNDVIDLEDLTLLSLSILGESNLTASQKMAADVLYDNEINLADLATLKQYISKIDVKLGDGYVPPAVTTPAPPVTTTTTTTTTTEPPVTTQKQPTGGVDISWIDPTKPMIAISFDDGTSQYGKQIVDSISKSGFHATFFYVGDWIRDESEVQYAFSKGMEIANHTASHPYLTQKSAYEIRQEADNCHNKLKNIIGAEPSKLLRLPYLAGNQTVQSTLNDYGLITCAIDTQDWNNASKDQIVSTIKSAMSNGSGNGAIVLCHETYATTAAAMEELCPYIKSQGWQLVTISELAAVKGKTLGGGQIYTKF